MCGVVRDRALYFEGRGEGFGKLIFPPQKKTKTKTKTKANKQNKTIIIEEHS